MVKIDYKKLFYFEKKSLSAQKTKLVIRLKILFFEFRTLLWGCLFFFLVYSNLVFLKSYRTFIELRSTNSFPFIGGLILSVGLGCFSTSDLYNQLWFMQTIRIFEQRCNTHCSFIHSGHNYTGKMVGNCK